METKTKNGMWGGSSSDGANNSEVLEVGMIEDGSWDWELVDDNDKGRRVNMKCQWKKGWKDIGDVTSGPGWSAMASRGMDMWV